MSVSFSLSPSLSTCILINHSTTNCDVSIRYSVTTPRHSCFYTVVFPFQIASPHSTIVLLLVRFFSRVFVAVSSFRSSAHPPIHPSTHPPTRKSVLVFAQGLDEFLVNRLRRVRPGSRGRSVMSCLIYKPQLAPGISPLILPRCSLILQHDYESAQLQHATRYIPVDQ
jgi:hypothetical protein